MEAALDRLKNHKVAALAAAGGVAVVSTALALRWSWRNKFRLMKTVDVLKHGSTREQRLLDYVWANSTHGDAASVFNAIDAFCRTAFMMHVGDKKGDVVVAEVKKAAPKVAVELGAYCGYSAVRIGMNLPPGSKLYSLELSPMFAAIARAVVERAGLSDVVTILVGSAGDLLPKLAQTDKANFVFIDHDKSAYLSDLKTIEACNLLAPGAVIVADNVIFPGAPDYLEYVRAHPKFDTVFHEAKLEYMNIRDGIEVSTFKGDD